MGKRFVDSEMVLKQWWRQLPPEVKVLWEFLRCRCDGAGVWAVDRDSAEFHVGAKLPWDTLPDMILGNKGEALVEEFEPGKWWIPTFCTFQYGTLSPNCKPHRPVLASLAKHGLTPVLRSMPSKPPKGIELTPSREKAVSKPERVHAPETEALYAYAIECFADAGHPIPKTKPAIAKAKESLRLLQEADKADPAEIRTVLEYMRNDTGTDTWTGWRAVVQSLGKFRKKYSAIRAQALRKPAAPKGGKPVVGDTGVDNLPI